MASTLLVDLVQTLSPEEEELVRPFIERLRVKGPTSILDAADEFISERPELLRTLAS